MKHRIVLGLVLAALALGGCSSSTGLMPQQSAASASHALASASAAKNVRLPDNVFHHVLCTTPPHCPDSP